MALLKFDYKKCNLCGECIKNCPFGAMSIEADGIDINEKGEIVGIF